LANIFSRRFTYSSEIKTILIPKSGNSMIRNDFLSSNIPERDIYKDNDNIQITLQQIEQYIIQFHYEFQPSKIRNVESTLDLGLEDDSKLVDKTFIQHCVHSAC
jgi:hypothetical protein